jgi:CBS domain-containing protein
VAEVMGTELFTLTPDTVVASALRLASARRIRHFLVIEDGSLTGIVCQSDLRQARESSLVSACMKSPVLCIGPDTTVKDAVDIMDQNEVGCLPVVTGTFLVGMITRDRLSKLTGKQPSRSLLASVELETEEQPDTGQDVQATTCTACGREDAVRLYYRAGMLPLCTDCAEVLPASRAPRGN